MEATSTGSSGTLKFLLLVFLACGFSFLFFSFLNNKAKEWRVKKMLAKAAATTPTGTPAGTTAAPSVGVINTGVAPVATTSGMAITGGAPALAAS